MSLEPPAEPLRLYLLGHFSLERDGASIALPRRKLELLLAYLSLHPQPHAREQLAARFWGDDTDASARSSLRNALPILRKKIGSDLLLIDRETVALNPAFPIWVDAREFMAAPDGASSQPTHSEIESLQAKIDLYRGELLADFYDDWILPERERLRARWIEQLLRRGAASILCCAFVAIVCHTLRATMVPIPGQPAALPTHHLQLILGNALTERLYRELLYLDLGQALEGYVLTDRQVQALSGLSREKLDALADELAIRLSD